MKNQIDPQAFEAAQTAAVFCDRSSLGMLKITGESRLDLIHRMSTQAVKNLKPGEGAATILTTDIARIIDRLILYAGSEAVYALTGENNAENIARYLMRFVFFKDDFHLQDLSVDTAIFAVYGPQAAYFLQDKVGLPEVDFPLHHWREVKIAGAAAYLHRTDPLNGFGYFIMSTADNQQTIRDALLDAGFIEADDVDFEYLRIAGGQPRLGFELTQDYIPIEAGLWDDVSFRKGCYIGQEIIARMESRGQIAKRLVRLQAANPMNLGEEIKAEGKKAGTITSTAFGPDGYIALGYVKTAVLDNQLDLLVGDNLVILSGERLAN